MPRVMKVRVREIFVGFVLILGFGLLPPALGYASPSVGSRNEEHSFRHHEHYSQRIEQVVNDFRHSQALQNRQNRSHVLLRHHHHHRPDERSSTRATTAAPIERPQQQQQQHHLRHYNSHHHSWERRVFPSMQHVSTSLTSRGAPTAREDFVKDKFNLTTALQGRYFDRDGLYSESRPRSILTTLRPKGVRYSYGDNLGSEKTVSRQDDLDNEDSEEDTAIYDGMNPSSSVRKEKQRLPEDEPNVDADDDDDDDEYYNDDNSLDDDDDYSNEEGQDGFDETTNRVDGRNLPKRRTTDFVSIHI